MQVSKTNYILSPYRDEAANKRKQLMETQGTLDSYKRELAERDEDIEELRAKLEELRGENDELKGENSQLEAQRDSRDEEIKDVRQQLQMKDAEIDHLEVTKMFVDLFTPNKFTDQHLASRYSICIK